jgi:hypothetical protein
LVTMWL